MEYLVTDEELEQAKIESEKRAEIVSQIHDLVRDMPYKRATDILHDALNRIDELAIIPPAS